MESIFFIAKPEMSTAIKKAAVNMIVTVIALQCFWHVETSLPKV
jgi:hypothetical protein